MSNNINLNGGVILKKNKDYKSIQEAQVFYEKFRMNELASSYFPETEYPEGFKELVIKLMKFENPVQMNVWHNRDVVLMDGDKRICTTWDNLCTFERPFNCAEMFQCVEIIKRATPKEVWDFNEIGSDEDYLRHFNGILYPKITEISNHIEKVLFEIEEQLCAPTRAKINSDLKVMHQMPVGSSVEFIKARERRM